MSSQRLPEMTQAQRDRLAHVELRLRFVGEIRRQDLVRRFGIQARRRNAGYRPVQGDGAAQY